MRTRLAILLTTALAVASFAEDPPKPIFQNSRFDDNDTTRAAALYHTPLAISDASSLSVGGQVRARGESWNNFAAVAANDDEFGLLRLRLHSDLRVSPALRIYVEGISAMATDRDLPGGKRPIDVDTADLLNAFADINADLAGAAWTLRLGRQELQYGKQRLVSPLDWVNTRRTFDGAKIIAQAGDLRVDGFATRLVQTQKYEFNDGDSGRDLYGVYATRKLGGIAATLDAYWLGLQRDDATFGSIKGDEERDTFGARLGGTCGDSGWDYDVEGGYQLGDVGDADAEAFFLASQLGYKLSSCPATPRLFVGYDYASGDDDASDDDVGTFNQLFPLGHAYFGGIDLVGRQNISDASAGVGFSPSQRTKARVEAHAFERAETSDALYDAGGNVVRAGNAGDSREIGQEVDLVLDLQWNTNLAFQTGYSHLFAGDFLEESGESEDIDFVYLTAQWTL